MTRKRSILICILAPVILSGGLNLFRSRHAVSTVLEWQTRLVSSLPSSVSPQDARRRIGSNGLNLVQRNPMPEQTLLVLPNVSHPDDEPSADEPWLRMDYGPFLSTAVGIGDDLAPVHKGIVVRLRTLNGEPTDLHAVFDTDLLAWRCVWEGNLALRGIVFDGPHGTFPEIEGEALLRLPAVSGVAPHDANIHHAGDPRDEPWGPIPTAWGRWSGVHLDGNDVIFEYTIGDERHRVFERVWAQPHGERHAFVREITVASRPAQRPTLAMLGPVRNAIDSPTISGWPDIERTSDGTTLLAPSNGIARVAIAPPDTPEPAIPAAHPIEVHAAIERARPRWGQSLVTRGVIDDPLDQWGGKRQLIRKAGDDATTIVVASADGGVLELLGDEVSNDAADALGSIVIRSAPVGSATPFREAERIGWWPSDIGHGAFERNSFSGEHDMRLDGVTWRRGVHGRALDFDGDAAAWLDDVHVDLDLHDLTVAAWIHTTNDGTIFAVAPRDGQWAPNGATLFLRGGRLSLDVGWVGVVSGGPKVDDGWWHHVAATWRHERGSVRLFVDGELVASGELPMKNDAVHDGFVARFGWTNENFPAVSRFSGYMDGLMLLRVAVADSDIANIASMTGDTLVEGTVIRSSRTQEQAQDRPWLKLVDKDGSALAQLRLPRVTSDIVYSVLSRRGPKWAVVAWASDVAQGPVQASPFRVDRLTWPDENPFESWMRFSAFDFLSSPDGNPTSVAIATWSGDVWRVDGLDEDIDTLRWTRVATGLNQPFGVVSRGEELLILGRDQITRLHDRNGDGQADDYENFNNDARNSEHFHEPASGLLVTPDGGLLYHKAARHAKHALHDHHGTVIRVSPDGSTSEVVARGFRAPIGLLRLPDGSLLGSDQEGHWMPANRINLIHPATREGQPPFFGNGWAARPHVEQRIERGRERVQPPWDSDAKMTLPMCWLHPSFDRSPSSQVYIDHPAWGPLRGSILGLSYGTGEVYLLLRDDVQLPSGGTITQGAAVKLGIQLPTGLLAGRIHPVSGDLFVCGLFGWSSDQTEPGGFYRIHPRAENWAHSLNVPHKFRALQVGLELTFLHPLDEPSATDPAYWSVQAWNYRRDADYGSADYDLDGRRDARTTWTITGVSLAADGRSVRLHIRDFEPAMQVHLTYTLDGVSGRSIDGEVHMTVHAVHR